VKSVDKYQDKFMQEFKDRVPLKPEIISGEELLKL